MKSIIKEILEGKNIRDILIREFNYRIIKDTEPERYGIVSGKYMYMLQIEPDGEYCSIIKYPAYSKSAKPRSEVLFNSTVKELLSITNSSSFEDALTNFLKMKGIIY